MKKILLTLMVFCFISQSLSHAQTNTSDVKIAFIRDGYVWLKVEDKEMKITKEKATYNYPPQWSFDGKMLLYQKEVAGNIIDTTGTSNELWIYDVATKKHRKIFYDGSNPKWSPIDNIVAFSASGVLNISDLKRFYNIALGVDDYAWQPDGKGFIASSSASLRPDGWTHLILYTISIEGYQNSNFSTSNAKKLFVIPKEIGKDDVKIISINAGSFTYSPNKQWIAFVVSPTASWSMDSDMLSVISVDGKNFEVIDELNNESKPKWAFTENLLGYIAGGGRIVFGFKNKELKVTELPADQTVTLTPKNYAEMGFSWVNDASLIVSRVQETEWSNDANKRPNPALYLVSLTDPKQIQITRPPKDQGDFTPIFLPSIQKITWTRKNDLVSSKGDLWSADPNGDHAKVWIRDIWLGMYDFFPSQ
ncbi:TolB domain-containing protein [Sporosarcina sp. ANT_H38]|uniref:TolB domain-containing protein n=1 Tax=Sporosarcina sp. ANT_H38 TaxID=2597358 RepID=UPI0011F219A5|nr:TolB domain-containing protein [Sporosarcina sp. ANT_H38]KAA0965959.1 TolB domain-containing protein [Sporosarcina sp. ANT_H38]